jgi:uncharacterized protein
MMFFILVFAVTWNSWYVAHLLFVSGGEQQHVPRTVFLYLGTFAPGLVAIGLTSRREGSAGIRALLRRLVKVDVPARWYIFALTFMIAIKLAVAVIYRVTIGVWPRFGAEPWYLMLGATLISMLFFGQAGEELGWRGYALPRLAQRMGLGPASLLLGVIWALWHLPLFLMPATNTSGQSFPLYVLQVTALSLVFAWLYAKTNGSLLLTMLLHAAVNNTKDIVPSLEPGATNPFALSGSLAGWWTVALLWVSAIYCLVRMPKLELRETTQF